MPGTQTAALGFGGEPTPAGALTESYNGTNWTAVNPLNTGRTKLAGVGTNTAALAFGGPSSALTETWEWNQLD